MMMNLNIPSIHYFSTYFPPTRDFRHESFRLGNISGRFSLLDYPKVIRNFKIPGSNDADEGTTKPLIDPARLPSRNRGKGPFGNVIRNLWPSVTFYNDTSRKVNLALLSTEEGIETSGILPLKDLEPGDHLRVYHSHILNYCQFARRKFPLQASTDVNGRSVKLLLRPYWLYRSDEVCLNLANEDRVFCATYLSHLKEVHFEEVPVDKSEAAPDILNLIG